MKQTLPNKPMKHDSVRRRMLRGLALTFITSPVLAKALLQATPPQAAGPFYPVDPPLDDDNDLTRVTGRATVARGEITDLLGQVLDLSARPVRDARVEIWQCDANGRYHHPRDVGGVAIDESFQGSGHTLTDAKGRYRFRTIRPVPYPGRTPHIHMAVFLAGSSPFVTQLYIRNEPRNGADFLFNRIPADQRHLVTAEFVPAERADVDWRANFDIVIGAARTP